MLERARASLPDLGQRDMSNATGGATHKHTYTQTARHTVERGQTWAAMLGRQLQSSESRDRGASGRRHRLPKRSPRQSAGRPNGANGGRNGEALTSASAAAGGLGGFLVAYRRLIASPLAAIFILFGRPTLLLPPTIPANPGRADLRMLHAGQSPLEAGPKPHPVCVYSARLGGALFFAMLSFARRNHLALPYPDG